MNTELLKVKLEAAVKAVKELPLTPMHGADKQLVIPHHFWLAVTNSLVQLMGERQEIDWDKIFEVLDYYVLPQVLHTLKSNRYLHPGEYDELNKLASYESYRLGKTAHEEVRKLVKRLHDEIAVLFGVRLHYTFLSANLENEPDLPFCHRLKTFSEGFIKTELPKEETKWKPETGETYWLIKDDYGDTFVVDKSQWDNDAFDNKQLRNNNVFPSLKAALQFVLEKEE
jgi:hypothetical protein|nr:MAG TPA: hypothetical protein [Caudoviricetes sp.]